MNSLNEQIGQPWRCVCPYCYSWHIVPINENRQVQAINGTVEESDNPVNYRCDECKEELRTVFDRKERNTVPIESLFND